MKTKINSRILLFFLILISTIIASLHYKRLVDGEKVRLQALAELYELRFDEAIESAIDSTEILKSMIILAKGSIPQEEISLLLSTLYKDDLHLAISYMPNGIVENSYPYEENNMYIGLNTFQNDITKNDAYKARETREITLSGPYELNNGMTGLVALNPIILPQGEDSVFWGFSTVLISVEKSLLKKTGLLDVEKFGYASKIDSINNENISELYKSSNYERNTKTLAHTFNVAQGLWSLSLYRPNIQYTMIQSSLAVALAFFAFSLLLFILFRKIEIQQKKTFEQSITDPITNLKNRKAFDLLEKENPFINKNGCTLFYIDLNKFKPVNDTHGHEAGDIVLKTFASRLSSHFKKDSFLARLGGDEFLVILPTQFDTNVCIQLQERIITIAETVFFVNNTEIYISASVGFAAYPLNAKTLSETLAIADKNMFTYKEKHGKGR